MDGVKIAVFAVAIQLADRSIILYYASEIKFVLAESPRYVIQGAFILRQ